MMHTNYFFPYDNIIQVLKDRDTNGDGSIDFQEFVGSRGEGKDKEWLLSEKDRLVLNKCCEVPWTTLVSQPVSEAVVEERVFLNLNV